MRTAVKRKLISSIKLGLVAIPFFIAHRIYQGGFMPGAIFLGFGIGFSSLVGSSTRTSSSILPRGNFLAYSISVCR